MTMRFVTGITCSMFAVCLLALLSGCVSLDPIENVESAALVVNVRSSTETGWDRRWDELSDVWDGVSPLSAEHAVRAALHNNHEIRTQVESIAASRADYVQAHLLPNPVINVAFGFPTDGLGGEPLAISLVQQLTWLWRRPAMIDAAEADLRARVMLVSDAALRLVADIRAQHARVVHAERTAAVAGQRVDRLKELSRLQRHRFEAGEIAGQEANSTLIALELARTQQFDRNRLLANSKRALLAMIGRAKADTAWRTDDSFAMNPDVLSGLDESAVMQKATTFRLDVAAAQAVVQRRDAQVEFALRGRLPDLSGGVGYQQNFTNRPGVFPQGSVTPKIFDDNSAQVAKAQSLHEQALIEADRIRQQVITESRTAWITFEQQQNAVDAYEENIVRLARNNVDIADSMLSAGEADLSSVIKTHVELHEAQIELADRRLAACEALIELERSVGGSLLLERSAAAHQSIATTRRPLSGEGGQQ